MNKSTLALIVALATAPFAMAQNLIVNGSFEIGAPSALSQNNGGGWNDFGDPNLGPTAAFVTGWTSVVPTGHTVTFALLNHDAGRPFAVDGTYMYNVGGFARERGYGSIFQDFSTSPGQQYSLSYFMGSADADVATDGSYATLFTEVYDVVSGATNGSALNSQTVSSPMTPKAAASNTMDAYGFLFTAIGSTTRLIFNDAQHIPGTSQISQLNIDAVSVTAIPEPSTYAAMAGAAMLGLAIYRRRRTAPVAA
jgi:hypothetical protein